MKKIIFSIAIVLFSSCIEQNQRSTTILPNVGVSDIKLGEKISATFNEEDFEIKTSGKEQVVTEIIIKSDKYKTKEGFGVGSNIDDIISKLGKAERNSMDLSKGNTVIGSVGKGLLYEGIFFLDMNDDKLVDGIWLFATE